ncbi:MAG: antitoxin [Acidobacteriota bacterium]
MNKLDVEEKEILAAYDNDRVTSVRGLKSEIARHRKVAANTFKKDARINIRIASRDLRALQKRALAEGIPYQTLIASVLHKYAEGGTP